MPRLRADIPTGHAVQSLATFSVDRAYRYTLTRWWDAGKTKRLWIMLNPSIADEEFNDPTVDRCMTRSFEDGFGGFVVCNIFALVSTDPKALRTHRDPIGPDNDRHILNEAKRAGEVVCAWGTHGAFQLRGPKVLTKLLENNIEVKVLKLTKDGHPTHPLYVSMYLKPVPIYSR